MEITCVVLQRFCMLNRAYMTSFQRMFAEQYEVIHRLETNKLRNIATLFAHLLHSDAMSWEVRLVLHYAIVQLFHFIANFCRLLTRHSVTVIAVKTV